MKILSEELQKYTNPVHQVSLTLGYDSEDDEYIFTSASETGATIEGWLANGDTVQFKVQYGQDAYAIGTVNDYYAGSGFKFGVMMEVGTGWFGPGGIYQLICGWFNNEGTWDTFPCVQKITYLEKFSDEDEQKLDGIETGAEENVITGIKTGNTSLTPNNKVVTRKDSHGCNNITSCPKFDSGFQFR